MDNQAVDMVTKDADSQPQAAARQRLASSVDSIRQDSADRLLPLADVQRGLWFVQQLAPDTAAYHLVFAARVYSALDIGTLTQALQTVIDRHSALRTSFIVGNDGQPRQHVAALALAEVAVTEAREWDESRLHAEAVAETRQPFNFARAPLLRVHVFSRAEDEHVLVLTAHHIAVDFWSLAVLLDELRTLYPALCTGADVELPPASEYLDYLRRERSLTQGGEGARMLEYWRAQLGDEPPPLELPADRARPPLQSYRGATHAFRFSRELTAGLRELARAEGVTLYMLLLAAYQALLHRYSGQDDIVVGSPVAGRTRREFRRTVGHFVNTVALRAAVSAELPFRGLLEQVRGTVVEALRHQEYPFTRIVEQVGGKRDPSRTPVFQASFAWERLPQFHELAEFFALGAQERGRIDFGGLSLAPYPLPQQEGQVDVALEMGGEVAGRLFGVWKYNVDLFDADTMAAMCSHFETLLHAIVNDPDTPVGRLPLLGATERERVLVEWNRTQAYMPVGAVHDLITAQAHHTPDRVALVHEQQQLSYRVLNQRANQLAHYLIEQGVTPGMRVGICTERTPDMVMAMLAVLKSGAAYVPLDPAYPSERIQLMMDDAEIAVLLTQAQLLATLPVTTSKTVCMDSDWMYVATYSGADVELQVDPDSVAYVIFTSGSTGRPKGVEVRHRGVVNFLTSMAREPGIGADDVLLSVTTLSFDIAVLELLLPLTVGARCEVLSRAVASDATELSRAMDESGVTLMQATPATWRMLLANDWPGAPHLTVLCGGEALPRSLADVLMARTRALWNMYGPTETTIWSTAERVTAGEGAVSIGRPIANTQVYVFDAAGQPVPIGVPGELYIGGAGVARGYLRLPELTEQRFVPDPNDSNEEARLYRTGDIVRWRREGKLEYLGRADGQVKLRGHRIELGEIETVLRRHPQVREAVVMVREEESDDVQVSDPQQRLVAYYTTSGVPPAAGALRDMLLNSLPAYMVPNVFMSIADWPLTPNGKIDRRALPAPAVEIAAESYVPPRDSVEIQLAALWEKLLDVRPIGVTADFFALGGHSLLAVQLVAAVRVRFGVELPVSSLFQYNTLESLARVIRHHDAEATTTGPLVCLRGGEKTPLFLLHPIGGTVFCYLALTRHLPAGRAVYALEAPGLDDVDDADVSIEDMARRYIEPLRARQAHGPYHLAGWCFGGVVAYEMTRQLRAAGEEVALLALFDSRAPIPENAPSDADDATLLSWFARDLAVPYNKTLSIAPEDLRALPAETMFDYVLERARALGVLPEDADPEQLQRYFQVYIANGIALQTYAPGACDVMPVLFLAHDEPQDYGPCLGWERVLGRRPTLVAVAGDHNSIMYEPQVQALAGRLSERLGTTVA